MEETTVVLEDGVYKKVVKEGRAGSAPAHGAKVYVHYTGRVKEIQKGDEEPTAIPELPFTFDSTKSRQPFSFNAGEGSN